jgi:uncharacterized protein YjiS (DUF1127 family)
MHTLVLELKRQKLIRSFSIKKILLFLQVCRKRSAMRHRLSQLPNYRLEDMGISREQALAESQKSYWSRV